MSALIVITTNNFINLLLPFIMQTHPSAFWFGSAGCAVYNLGTGRGTSVLEMVAAFEKASGKVVSKPLIIGPLYSVLTSFLFSCWFSFFFFLFPYFCTKTGNLVSFQGCNYDKK
jgi:hypothetical protein